MSPAAKLVPIIIATVCSELRFMERVYRRSRTQRAATKKATQESAYNQRRKTWHAATKMTCASPKKFKNAVEARLEQAPKIPDHALRSLGGVAEAARRIARLTLGVSTKNVHVSHDPYAQMSDQELAAALTRLGIQ